MLLSVKTLTTEQLDNSNDFLTQHKSSKIWMSHVVPVVHLRRGMPQEEHKSDWPHNYSICSTILFGFFFNCGYFICLFNWCYIRDILQRLDAIGSTCNPEWFTWLLAGLQSYFNIMFFNWVVCVRVLWFSFLVPTSKWNKAKK